MVLGGIGRRQGRLLRGEGGSLARAAKTQSACARPGNNVALRIRNRYKSIVERRLNEHRPAVDNLLFLLLKSLLLGRLSCCCFSCHRFEPSASNHRPSPQGPAARRAADSSLRLRGRLLLVGNRSLARSFPRARVGMVALPADRQVSPVAETPVGTDFNQPPDIHGDFFAQVSFHRAFFLQNVPDPVYFILRQIPYFLIWTHTSPGQKRIGASPTDAINVGQPDLRALLRRQVNSCNARHKNLSSSSLPLFVLGVYANHADHPAPADDLAFVANLFYRSPYFHALSVALINLRRPSDPRLRTVAFAPLADHAAPPRVEGRKLHLHQVTGKEPQKVFAPALSHMGQNAGHIFQLDPVQRSGQD